MNKGQLVEAVQKKLGKDTTKAAADAALNAVIDCITAGVKKDKEKGVQIIGFGTFSIVKRAARKGINQVLVMRVVKFHHLISVY